MPPQTATPSPRRFEDFTSSGDRDILQKVADLDAELARAPRPFLEGLGLSILGPAAPTVDVRDADGKAIPVVMLGSNSYLDLTTHPAVIAASQAACATYGYGMGAVPLYAGTTDLHRELEARIAAFYGKQDAVLFPCGYSGNVGVISALCGPGDVILNDSANHASIFDGARLSGADLKVYVHGNIRHLEKLLRQLPAAQKGRLIVTDGVFSMEGDVAPLDQIVELARRYGARVMVDDAHGLGVVGPGGRGSAAMFGLGDAIDITYGTLSKAPGAVGGYCAGSAALVRYLRFYARSYFFSTSLPAPVIAGLIEVFKLLEADQAGRQRLWENIAYLKTELQALRFDTGASASAIIPLAVGDEDKLAAFQNDLRRHGVFANIVTYPAVRRKQCRLRLSVMQSLSRAQMDHALSMLARFGRCHGIIP